MLQYLKDTRGELHHVAWPTRLQTVVYTILVISISVLLSLYLGFFDFAFTRGLGKVVETLPQTAAPAEQPANPALTPSIDISTTTVN